MTFAVDDEIISQPECWTAAARVAAQAADRLPAAGERVAYVGCGTSWFIGQAAAGLREAAGLGESDAFTAMEFPRSRVGRPGGYDRVVAITRSGTTTEVLQLLGELKGHVATVAVAGDLDTPIVDAAEQVIDLSFADERSVVQTRFATSALSLLRAHLGADLAPVIAQGSEALAQELPQRWIDCEQITFLGQAWTIGIANEAALKFRESSSSWAEAYPAMDYRHGPISIAAPNRLVWCFGPAPEGLADQVQATGAEFVDHDRDAQADLVTAQRLAIARAASLGVDPDSPRNLTRSVVLGAGH